MKRLLTVVSAGLLAFACFTLLPGTANAQNMKLGFVNNDSLLAHYKGWTAAQEEYQTQYKAWNDEAESKKTELQTMIDDYDKQRLILSDDKKKEREAQIRAKNDDLDAYAKNIFGPGGLAEQKHASLVKPLLEKISKAIEAVALAENYDVIFTLESIGYIRDSYDVTDKVVKYLEENE